MRKTKSKVYKVELLLIAILVLCTLFRLLNNRIFTACLLTIITIALSFFFKNDRVLKSNRKKVTIVILIFAILYIALFYVMGIYTGFYAATIKFSIKTIGRYILPITIIIIATEIIRNKLLVDQTKKSKTLIFLIGTIIDVSVYRNLYNLGNIDSFLAFIGLIIFASIANNLLYNYISSNYGPKAIIYYKLITILYIYIIPVAPNVYAYLRAFLRMIYPLIIYLYLDKYYALDKYKETPKEEKRGIVSIMATSVVILLLIALISCNFLYGILVVGSSSMKGAIDKGDAVVFKSIKKNIKEGDVIVFERDNIRVVHRVIAVKNINNETRYYTKGDTNKLQDEGYVTENTLKGKVLFKIKYIGRPTLWLRSLFE